MTLLFLILDAIVAITVTLATTIQVLYLESLRTYEMFASSDDLFARAVERFGLREGSKPIEKLKRSVLKIVLARNTKILEISATLPDPRKAHTLALYIAEETVKLNRAINREGDLELTADAAKQAEEARTRRNQAEQEWVKLNLIEPVDDLSQQVESALRLKSHIQETLVTAELDDGKAANTTRLRAQIAALDKEISSRQALLSQRFTRREEMQRARAAAQETLDAAERRLRETRGAEGSRGERLKIVDPGIVPERPSSPNISLNLVAAFFAALIAAVLYLTVGFSFGAAKAVYATRR